MPKLQRQVQSKRYSASAEADKGMRKINREEQDNCIALIQWRDMQINVIPELRLLIHIPNGGYRTKVEAGILKAMGARAGVWDYQLPLPRMFTNGVAYGLILEMKRADQEKKKDGGLTKEQIEYRDLMVGYGYVQHVAYNWLSARAAILAYLGRDDGDNKVH